MENGKTWQDKEREQQGKENKVGVRRAWRGGHLLREGGMADEQGNENGEGGAPQQPTSNRAMFLPSYSLPFSVSVLLMKGLLSLGLPSPEKAEEPGVWRQLVVLPLTMHPAAGLLELSEPPFNGANGIPPSCFSGQHVQRAQFLMNM